MLSKKTKYALNALVYLAKKPNQTPTVISEIAKEEHIPQKFLELILLELKNAGYLNSKKGKGGGYYLLRKADDISIADIIRLFEGAIALLPCVTFKYYERCEECKDEITCGIRDLFKEVRDESVKILKNNSLSDIINREKGLKKEI
jgi:Rrf2 family protein